MGDLKMDDLGITSKFEDAHGTGAGYQSPAYDVDDVAIVVQDTEKGFLVHQGVGWGEDGTGEFTGDAIKYYSNEDFAEEIGDNFVTLERYQRDAKGLEGIHQTSAANSPVADDAAVMQDRLREVGRDMNAYQDNLAAQINELQQQSGMPALGCGE